ncbi:MAG: cell division protein ZapB [Shewanella sp.]|nr:cell division protein ZapB [Shewanella sp.]MCF1431921.1 cell division protein ZapB [Shewanella sp.]MCF1437250.1 cell division protein ZapB [Shewanella sp.]MCF1459060.1 cell division protein ZapB [Shewanella sp.]
MSLELLSQLETKIQAALESIELQKMELEEEKHKNVQLQQHNEQLQQHNEQLQQELSSWNEKVTGLVGLLNNEVD